MLASVEGPVRAALEHALEHGEIDRAQALVLFEARGAELDALAAVADRVRREQVGDVVGYVVNRNINFTNVCVKACKFCAFARGHRSEQSYFLGIDEIVRRAVEARDLGATEVCIQAGLAPGLDGRHYVTLCRAVKQAAPELHVHAFSPEEVKYGAGRAGVSIRDYLCELRDAGLGSLPGTSAEVLDDGVRARISPGRISTAEWIDVIRAAHELGLPTTSTLMFGHVETALERVRHLELLRAIQRETGGFTEFVPLSFVHHEAPMYTKGLVPGVRPGATEDEVIRLYAIARLVLGLTIRNVQASWVKQGLPFATRLLACGANDLGGTLMNESISTAAGAGHGQFVAPSRLRRAIEEAGRIPRERDTRYHLREPRELPALERIQEPDAAFGSYVQLTRDARFRFKGRPAAS